jgi:hypothetical protein
LKFDIESLVSDPHGATPQVLNKEPCSLFTAADHRSGVFLCKISLLNTKIPHDIRHRIGNAFVMSFRVA